VTYDTRKQAFPTAARIMHTMGWRRRPVKCAVCAASMLFFFLAWPAAIALCAGGPNQFVILSDTQRIEGVDQLTREVIDLAPPFVVSVGDVPSAFDPRVRHFYRLREAGIEIHIAIGNHDEGVRPLLQSCLPPYPFNSEVDPILRYAVDNKYYYSFNRGGIHFCIIDTCTHDTEAEIAWLEADLVQHVNNPNRYPTLLFMHYPDWMLGDENGTGGPVYQVLSRHPDQHTVKAAFAGHTHQGKRYPSEQTLGIPFYTLYPSAPFGAALHTEYVLATVHPDRITFERRVILDNGKRGDFVIEPVEGTFGPLKKQRGGA